MTTQLLARIKFIVGQSSFKFFSIPLLFNLLFNLNLQGTAKTEVFLEIQNRIDSMKQAMRDMGAANIPETPPPSSYRTSLKSTAPPSQQTIKFEEEALPPAPVSNERGFYFIPFGGAMLTSDFKDIKVSLTSSQPSYMLDTVEFKVGHSLGIRLGYSWKYFFLEERFSYLEADIKSQSLNLGTTSSPIPAHFSGTSESLSFHQALGFRIPITEKLRINLGGGVGVSKQDIQYSISHPMLNLETNEREWILSYDASLGLEYQPFAHFLTGINYRWIRIEGKEEIPAHEMHLIELSLGLLF